MKHKMPPRTESNRTETASSLNLHDIYQIIQTAIDSVESSSDTYLQSGKNAPSSVIAELYQNLSSWLDAGNQSSHLKNARACQSGCSACCTQLIPVTPLEAIHLSEYLKRRYRESELLEITKSLEQQAERYKTKKSVQFGPSRIPCSFLDGRGNCLVHEARPGRCRGYFSLSREACYDNVLDPSKEIPVDGFAVSWVRGAHSGLSGALERAGLDGAYYELQDAVGLALRDPETGTKWLKGERTFSRCTKAKAQPKVIWLAPQEDGQTVLFKRSGINSEGQRIQVDFIGGPTD